MESGYVYELMDQGGPTDVRESYFKEAVDEMMRARVLAAVYGGGKHRWKLQGDFTLRKEDDVWKLSSSRASTY